VIVLPFEQDGGRYWTRTHNLRLYVSIWKYGFWSLLIFKPTQ